MRILMIINCKNHILILSYSDESLAGSQMFSSDRKYFFFFFNMFHAVLIYIRLEVPHTIIWNNCSPAT